MSKFVKRNEEIVGGDKSGNCKEITVLDQNSERRGSIYVKEILENQRKGFTVEDHTEKNIGSKNSIHEIEKDDDSMSIDLNGSQKGSVLGSVQGSIKSRGDIENDDENKDEVEKTFRKKKTGQFKDVMRRSRSFSFSQKMVKKNLDEKIDHNDTPINHDNKNNIK